MLASFIEIRILVKIKRCQTAFLSKGAEVNLYHAFLGGIFAIFHRRYLSFFYLDDLYLFTNCVGVIPIYSLNCRLK